MLEYRKPGFNKVHERKGGFQELFIGDKTKAPINKFSSKCTSSGAKLVLKSDKNDSIRFHKFLELNKAVKQPFLKLKTTI